MRTGIKIVLFLIIFSLALVVGFFIGRIEYIRKHTAGQLRIDVTNPMNDQPFLLMLDRDVNDVYTEHTIVLEITHN